MYPRLLIDIEKLRANLDGVAAITKDKGKCSLMIVTKGMCADEKMTDMIAAHPAVDYMADSRIANLKTYADKARNSGKETLLLRLPMACEIAEAVEYADVSFNSELTTIKALNEEAGKRGKSHKIVVMIDLGDLREGLFYKEEKKILDLVEQVLSMENIELLGVGTNLTCYGAIIPKNDNLSILVDWARRLEEKFDISLAMISGGNSSSIYLIENGSMPERINNLRLGEAFLLGNDTAYGAKLSGTCDDALILETQVVEIQEKPSLPIGEVGKDAFGHTPEHEDRGIIKRAILAIGQQDTSTDSIEPLDESIEILGSSSDHLIMDVTKAKSPYKVGDVVSFKVGYGAMLKAATSKYVEKVYK